MTKLEELKAAYEEALSHHEDGYNYAYAEYYLTLAAADEEALTEARDLYVRELEKQDDKNS